MLRYKTAAGDRQGRPDAETLKRVEGHTLLRTDRNGWIVLTTDGEHLRVEVERRKITDHSGWNSEQRWCDIALECAVP